MAIIEKRFPRISMRQDITENWKKSDLVLNKGELGIEYADNNIIKIKTGNGIDVWNNLPYLASSEWGLIIEKRIQLMDNLRRVIYLFMIMNMVLVLFIIYILVYSLITL